MFWVGPLFWPHLGLTILNGLSTYIAVMAGGHFVVQTKILSQDTPPHWRAAKAIWGNIQCIHMSGWLDVPGPPPNALLNLVWCGNKRQRGGVDFALQLPQHCFWFWKETKTLPLWTWDQIHWSDHIILPFEEIYMWNSVYWPALWSNLSDLIKRISDPWQEKSQSHERQDQAWQASSMVVKLDQVMFPKYCFESCLSLM